MLTGSSTTDRHHFLSIFKKYCTAPLKSLEKSMLWNINNKATSWKDTHTRGKIWHVPSPTFSSFSPIFYALHFFHHKAVRYVDVQTAHEPPPYVFALTVFQIQKQTGNVYFGCLNAWHNICIYCMLTYTIFTYYSYLRQSFGITVESLIR